jgi:hypothetical protein
MRESEQSAHALSSLSTGIPARDGGADTPTNQDNMADSPDDGMGPPDGLGGPTPKRRRVTRACDECRRKKIKCDGKQVESSPDDRLMNSRVLIVPYIHTV